MLTEFYEETGAGSISFDVTNTMHIAILNTSATYIDMTITGTDSFDNPFSYDERIEFTAQTIEQMISDEYAKFTDNIIDLETWLKTGSVTITLPSETDTIGLIKAGYFTKLAKARQDGFVRTSKDTFSKNRSTIKKKYSLVSTIQELQTIERMLTNPAGEYALFTIPSDNHGGFFSIYGKVKLGDSSMKSGTARFTLEVEQ